MLVWRICRAQFAADPLSGEGARLFGGRWNQKGTRLVYAAGSQSLATLECLVHLDLAEIPPDFQAVAIEIPDALPRQTFAAASLPPDWRTLPGPESLKALGSAWARAGKEPVLWVPSAIIANEWDVLINPEQPLALKLEVRPPIPFAFDPRLFQGGPEFT